MTEPSTDVARTLKAVSVGFSGEVTNGMRAPSSAPLLAVRPSSSNSLVSVPTFCTGVAQVWSSGNLTAPLVMPWHSVQPPCVAGRS